jgi:hypothetical protein
MYPGATEEDLLEAHSYAYGGCIIQDMGYYPFGNHLFTDFTHYVRAGDFIKELLDQAQNLNEYAFALGALAHYSADTFGHSVAINRSVPEMSTCEWLLQRENCETKSKSSQSELATGLRCEVGAAPRSIPIGVR